MGNIVQNFRLLLSREEKSQPICTQIFQRNGGSSEKRRRSSSQKREDITCPAQVSPSSPRLRELQSFGDEEVRQLRPSFFSPTPAKPPIRTPTQPPPPPLPPGEFAARLGGEISTASCGRHLAEVLRENQSLRKLELTFKSPDDKTMELLCNGLNDPECTVKELKLGGEILTMSCSRHLAEVLRRNQRLRELELALKNPDAKTMELLCEGLKHPQCTIEILDLDGETLTESSSRHLAEVLRKNQGLDALLLSLKNLDDKPMEELCEGLKHPECTIEMLHLAGETLTESSSRHLAEVLRKNQRLNVLFLSLKNPDDKAMEVLCEGLKHPECAIETLELAEEILTESYSRHFAEALRRNQRLRELSLSLKNPDDKTMELLCEGLKHPQCTIETLQLDGEILTTSCSRHLAEVFMKNQRLKELELSRNNCNFRLPV
ncbi:NACHT, LRR and PYD domains-containing protein 12-like [Pantherophis guttatus]|uniref:NACHT, LRR and PYD domains-containing protein 12-like n=1 Tax=Pantherophis guttatus TaxID=94885 RepID=A0ABM3YSM1_PANGU|nr:NACHT, LRR and PYD domains-containing protein 12-like [Pantherophis guttatus]